jgi:signal transduction histidine kinase
MKFAPLVWLRSLHAKLFLLTASVTASLTIAVALVTSNGSKQYAMEYARKMACDQALNTEHEIHRQLQEQKDYLGEFRHSQDVDDMLTNMAGPDRTVFQIDVFRRLDPQRDGAEGLSLVGSSLADNSQVEMGADLASYLKAPGPQAMEVNLSTGNLGWKVLLPIASIRSGKPPVGLIRLYLDMEPWETVWTSILRRTYQTLPPVILGEFIILWVILGFAISDPLRVITGAMKRLERGDTQARAHVQLKDELGLIADQFNSMAGQLHLASEERERLIQEIRGLNANLQERIDEALSELQAKNQEMEQQERLAVAGQLTAAFAHEVGTPLNLVNSHLQLLINQGDLSTRTRERLDVIHTQIQRVGDIVRKLLGLTRRPQLHQEATPLRPFMESMHTLWMPNLTSHQVAFELDAPENCALFVDRRQMEQIFINLVNNAVDAMPEGGRLELRVRPEEALAGSAPRWLFELEDTGGGIPPDLLSKVFKPMFTTKPEGKGTGLGLPIVREIVRNHGGDVRLESREGVGTTVCFSLPGVA